MEVVKYEECEGESKIVLEQRHARLTARRDEKTIELLVGARCGRECDGVESVVSICFTCAEWRRLLCELGRVHCGPDCCSEPFWYDRDDDGCCEEEPVVAVFDQDDCEPRSVEVSVRELREAIKGCHADDVIVITED